MAKSPATAESGSAGAALFALSPDRKSGANQSFFQGFHSSLRSVANSKFFHDMTNVSFYGLTTDHQSVSYFLI